jgi:hypothetical protein
MTDHSSRHRFQLSLKSLFLVALVAATFFAGYSFGNKVPPPWVTFDEAERQLNADIPYEGHNLEGLYAIVLHGVPPKPWTARFEQLWRRDHSGKHSPRKPLAVAGTWLPVCDVAYAYVSFAGQCGGVLMHVYARSEEECEELVDAYIKAGWTALPLPTR